MFYDVWFRGVVVITSALHAEGREFETRRNLHFLVFVVNLNILKRLRVLICFCTAVSGNNIFNQSSTQSYFMLLLASASGLKR